VGKGHQQAIVSLVERVSRYTLLQKVVRKTASAVAGAMIEQLRPLSEQVQTVTVDNGKEFAAHQSVAEAVSAQTYFAHPYSSWERGLNENTNGLVRQYCPKKSDFAPLSRHDIQKIADQLNHRPRKVLDYRTPHEVFFDLQNVALTT
jgi:IS30 family transposase